MNSDVGALFSRLGGGGRGRNALSIVLLLVGTALAALGATTLLGALAERSSMESQYEVTAASVIQVERMRQQGPIELRAKLDVAQAKLTALLDDFPTAEQVRLTTSGYYNVATRRNATLARFESLIPSDTTPPQPAKGAAQPAAGQTQPAQYYAVERYSLEAHGEFANLVRFMADIMGTAYKTFSFDSLAISPDGPSVVRANLTAFSSDLKPVQPAAPAAAPATGSWAPGASATAEVARLESVLRGALAAKDWRVAISYGERALALAPGRSDLAPLVGQAHTAYARELSASGDAIASRQHLMAALSLWPGDPVAQAELRALDASAPLGR